MKTTKILTACTAAALTITMNANAQGGEKKGKRAAGPLKEMREKFDKDGDGELNDAERAELKKEIMKRREVNQAKMLQRFDTDKDGEISHEEKKAARPVLSKERKEIKEAALKEFDKDGDGTLSADERKGTKQWIQKNHPDAILMLPRGKGRAGMGLLNKRAGKCDKKGPKGSKNAPEEKREEQAAE